jgi:hypothetical protein
MEQKENPTEGENADSKGPESGAFGILLNAPSIISRLVDTALLLSLFTGVLYIWGATYFAGFIRGLELTSYTFAFNIPANDVLLAGTNVISYYVVGLPFAYMSVGILLMVVIIAMGLVQLILVPVLARLARSLTPLLARIWTGTGARLINLKPFRWIGKMLKSLAPKKPAREAYERALAWLAGSVELYITHAIIASLLLVLILWGGEQSWKLGLEASKSQLNNSPQVQIVYGENEKFEGKLCGRIGSDYILKSQDQNVKYEIVKEPTIKHIIILQPQQQKTP